MPLSLNIATEKRGAACRAKNNLDEGLADRRLNKAYTLGEENSDFFGITYASASVYVLRLHVGTYSIHTRFIWTQIDIYKQGRIAQCSSHCYLHPTPAPPK